MSRSGSRTRPAIIAPVSRPTKAQNTGASDPNTTAASDSPETFHAAAYLPRPKLPQPNIRTTATGPSPNNPPRRWKFPTDFAPSRYPANTNQLTTPTPATATSGKQETPT